jgi:hypothetical protein
MRDERSTNKFIKELNKNNKNYNSTKAIPFSFSGLNLKDELYLSHKSHHVNSFYMREKENQNTNNIYNRTNSCIKKNCSFDNFRHAKRKSFQSTFNIVNNKMFNCINGDKNSINNAIMPANQAE